MEKNEEKLTDAIINQEYGSRKEQIESLKKISESLKTDPAFRVDVKKNMNGNDQEKVTKSKTLILKQVLNSKVTGFAAFFILSFVTTMISGGSFLYILLENGIFN